MCEDRCLSHGCVMEYDYRSGFTLCPQCEEESVPVNELLALQAQAKPRYITVPELNHLAWVIVHNGLEPDAGFGGCSCDTCSLLRDCMKAIREKEAREYIEAMHRRTQ